MASKLVFVLLLAVLGAQAAKIQPKPEPKDLRVVVVNLIKIAGIIGDKLQTGIEEARPIIEDLEGELNTDLAQDVHELLAKLEGILGEIVGRVKTLEKEVTDSIDAVNNEAKTCVDKSDAGLDEHLEVAEAAISVEWRALLKRNNENITSIEAQIREILTKLDAVTDKCIAAGVACVKKGSTTVKACLDANSEEWNTGVQSALVDSTLVLNEAMVVIPGLIGELIKAIQPIVEKFLADADPVWVEFGDCVAKLQ